MTTAESLNYARKYLTKANEYLDTAQDSLDLERPTSAAELRTSLAGRADAPAAEKALRELIAMKGDVEYGTKAPTLAQATTLVRRARTLVELADEIVRGR